MDPRTDITIVRLADGDVTHASDHLADFKKMILGCDQMYPGIEKWLQKKVLPGVVTGERTAFVGYLDDRPVVTAVAKKGEAAKICHLKIAPELQNTNLGEVFFSLMGIELRSSKITPGSAHLTLPESLWESKGEFFNSFGFSEACPNDFQYRMWDQELRSEVSFPNLWHSIISKMPKLANIYSLGGISLDSQLLLSIQPRFAQLILNGRKKVELRRKFSKKWVGSRISIYESGPSYQVVGEATIAHVCELTVQSLWDRYNDVAGCTRQEFDGYFKGVKTGYAIELIEVTPFRYPVSLMWLSKLLSETLVPPQSYLTLENNKPWAQAISLSAYVQGCLGGASNKAKRLVDAVSRLEIPRATAKSATIGPVQLPLQL